MVGPVLASTLLGAFVLVTLPACGLTELQQDEVGEAPRCAATQTWPAEFAALENEFADAVAGLRDTGAMCGDVELDGVGDLVFVPELRCAARLDATERVQAGDIDRDSTAITSAFERVNLAGYDGIIRHQFIAADFFDAVALFNGWVGSDEHCNALLDKTLDHIGVGHSRSADDASAVWVVFTGEERD